MAAQQAVSDLLRVSPVLDDSLDQEHVDAASALIDQFVAPVSEHDVRALIPLLPANGDAAYGLNRSLLPAIESSECRPVWDLLNDDANHWTRILLLRLANDGQHPPRPAAR